MRRYYSKAHYQRLSNGGPDVQGAEEERLRLRRNGELAHAEMLERFAPLTSDNAGAAIAWQAARISELNGQ